MKGEGAAEANKMIRRISLLVLTLYALQSASVFSCSCSRPSDPNFWFDKAESILVVVPRQAVYEETGVSSGEIHATVRLLDVLKGPRPKILPTMVSHRDEQTVSSCGEWDIALGVAYILYLDRANQEIYRGNTCGPVESFFHARHQQELYCFEGHPQNESGCSPKLLKRLRRATEVNERYDFDEHWMNKSRDEIRRKVQVLKAEASSDQSPRSP